MPLPVRYHALYANRTIGCGVITPHATVANQWLMAGQRTIFNSFVFDLRLHDTLIHMLIRDQSTCTWGLHQTAFVSFNPPTVPQPIIRSSHTPASVHATTRGRWWWCVCVAIHNTCALFYEPSATGRYLVCNMYALAVVAATGVWLCDTSSVIRNGLWPLITPRSDFAHYTHRSTL
jgi:hypothetical protein